MAKTRAESSSTSKPSGSSSKSSNSASTSKLKSLRPLSSVLGFGGAGASSTTSSLNKPSTSPPKKKNKSSQTESASLATKSTTRKKRKTGQSSDPVDPIELSSDEEDDVQVEDFLEIKDDTSATEASDDDVLVTGFNASAAVAGPSNSSSSTPKAKVKVQSSKTATTSPAQAGKQTGSKKTIKSLSEKAKGKLKAVDTSLVELDIKDTREGALWSQKYEPVDFDSLCVHKKKVQDVQRWLEEAYAGGTISKYRRIMILSGPPGSGKTATLRVLSREMGFDIVEYKTSEGNSEPFANQFPSFLAKSTLTTALQFGVLTSDNRVAVPKIEASSSPNAASDTKPNASTLNGFTIPKSNSSTSSAPEPPKRRKLILVEDLPNIFTSQGTRTAFRNALVSLSTSKRFTATAPNANVPLVIIVSEALTRPGQNEGENAANRYQGTNEQSVSVRSVVPVEVLKAPVAAEFKFNPVAPTLMKKALNAILDREYATSSSKRPSQRAVQLVIEASDGDIRSALNTLQFIVGDAAPVSEIALETAKKKGKKRKSSGKVKEDDIDESANKALMHLVATKESSLFLFHALGKVLFNKRWGENPDEDAKSTTPRPPKTDSLPSHLKPWERRPSKVDTNGLFSDAPVESDMFMAYLHQNYPPFCDDIENCANLMDYTSVADAIMRMEGDSFSRHALTSHYSFQVSVRGALLSLPSPVQRRGQKMYKSELWECQRKSRENMDRIGDWMTLHNKAHITSDTGEDLLPKKLVLQLETLPFMGMMQAPQRSFLANAGSSISSSNNPFKQPRMPASSSTASQGHHGAPRQGNKLSNNLLEIAMFPPPAYMKSLEERGPRIREALDEKEVPDVAEADEDEMKMKPSAPAVKMEDEDEDREYNEEEEDGKEGMQKLYLSDDDIGDF